MDDTGEIFIPTICSNCWYTREIQVYNVNGKCDRCGGTDFIEIGYDPDETKEMEFPLQVEALVSSSDLPGMWELGDFTGGDPDERSYSAREKVQQQIEELRAKPRKGLPTPDFMKDNESGS